MIQFNEELAPLAYALFYRSYGRYHNGQRETIEDVLEGRTIEGLKTLGNLTPEEVALITKYQQQLKVFTSGRGLFVQGTPAATKPENVYSHYNCSNINIEGWSDFGLLMNLAMQGTGTGAKLEPQHINKLPPIRNKLIVEVKDEIGSIPANQRIEESKLNVIYKQEGIVLIELHVGDSRKGWVQAYQSILELSSADSITPLSNLPNVHFFRDESNYPTSISKLDLPLELSIHIYLANVRPKNEPLKGFGGVSNPSALPPLFSKCAAVLNKAIGRQLNSVECCKLIDEAATTIVAGNIRRCLPLGTGIQTDWGITPIEDIGIGDRVLTTSGLKKVTDIFHQGQQPLVKITTSDRCLYCSPNHKIAIPDEFITDSFHKLTKSNGKRYSMIPAIDLTIGQVIQISLMDEDEGDPYFLFGQFGNELQEALELEFFDPIKSNKPIEGLIPCYSFLKSKLQSLLLENGYEYTTSQIMIGDYSRVSILIQDYERLNREPEVLQKIEDIYSTLIGNSYIYSSITYIDYDTGIERATFDIEVEEAHEFYAEGILVSNSAGMRQGASDDKEFAVAKDNLWLQDSQGNWKIDLERDALRMSNHTRVFKHKPTYEECLAAVTKQYYSGEGAIQWAGEAVARSNADLLISKELKQEFLDKYASSQQEAIDFLYTLNPYMDEKELQHRLGRWGLNPCGEIIGDTFLCNLSDIQLNRFNPLDLIDQKEAFKTAGLLVAILLNHKFPDEITQYSREIDPIVGVSFNGLFDFFVNALGIEWLRWWQSDRDKNYQGELQPEFKSVAEVLNIDVNNYQEGDTYKLGQLFYDIEKAYLSMWKQEVFSGVYEYCDARGLKRPNRTTCVQPGGCGDRSLIRVTDQGLIYMDEIMEDGAGDISGLELSVRNGILVNKGIANEPSNLVKIVLNNGRILRLTADHRLAVNDNWLSVEELIPGMSLDYKLDTYDSKKNYPLVKIDFSSYTKYNPNLSIGEYKKGYITPISLPDTLSPDLAYLIGAMYGNGCCDSRNGTGRVRFTHEKVEVLNKIQDISEKVFGFRGSVSSSCTKKLELILSSTLLYDWLNLNQLIKKEKDLERIPFPVRCSSKETILGFFCGLIDTDGCIRRGGTLSIDSASEAFIRNLQQIGEAIGLSFSVFHNNKGKNLQGQKDMWGLCFSRMLSTPEAIQYINEHSVKAQTRPIPLPKKQFNFNPYQIAAIEYETTPDYSFDITVEGKDDDDSWYWQGALKSHNSKSLLTGASSGWHPPKAAWFIRRMTFRREDPIALAALDYGYTIVPSQSCKDEEGNLLNDPFDPRVDEWLLEVPVQVAWADIPGVEDIDISQLSAEAQWDFYMNVQAHYTTHNCFSRDTSFLTPQGLKTFYDFEVNDKVIVLNADGDWSEATIIKTNDVRPMLELSLVEETTNSVMTITCTYCHRFPIGSLILTAKELQVGMTLSLNPLALQDCSWTIESIREAEPQEGWCVMEPITHHFTLSNNILVMNSSGTIEFQEHEISIMASNIFHSIQNDEGYISVALLQRLTSYFPRLPMEPISKTTYIELRKEVLSRRKSPDFHSLLQHYSQLSGLKYSNPQDSACEGLICELRSFSQ